jgi:hypothetical protein
MWVDSLELAKGIGGGSSLSLKEVTVEAGPTIALLSDLGSTNPNGKRCDMHLYTGLYGTMPKRDRRTTPPL